MNRFAALAAMGVLLSANTSQAIISASWSAAMSGSYTSGGYHGLYNWNYFADDNHRNFFAFWLYDFEGGADSATITVNTGVTSGGVGTYTIYSVVYDPYVLNFLHTGDTEGQQIYQDLGDGDILGSWSFPLQNDTEITLELNSLGLAAVNNSAGGWFAFGGVLSGGSAFSQTMTGERSDIRAFTTHVIPEPGSLSLLLAGIPCTVGACLNRRKRLAHTESSK